MLSASFDGKVTSQENGSTGPGKASGVLHALRRHSKLCQQPDQIRPGNSQESPGLPHVPVKPMDASQRPHVIHDDDTTALLLRPLSRGGPQRNADLVCSVRATLCWPGEIGTLL